MMNLSESLQELKTLIQFLPSSLPEGFEHHDFLNWQPDPDKLDTYRARESVLNQDLEVLFAPGGRQAGDIPFKLCERGTGLLAVVDVLASELVVHPESAILLKWVEDLKNACKAQFHKAKLELPTASQPKPLHVPSSEARELKALAIGKRKEQEVPVVCLLLQSASAMIWDDYEPLDKLVVKKAKGGRQPCQLGQKLALACYKKRDPACKLIFRCIGMDPARQPAGCTTVCDKIFTGPH
ncbi:hypothetical protein BDN71DRAFT_1433553 [Pleurotus eryngii]|uniref:Uncharacterized protein n=1 Tax=Pleurotus eryngii TaxID=5323 RepID=A0A9P6D5N2_PLEER|nr:hypothetical protein BDN71DRAFT_1433553 [Pleurotus eryngii]